VTANAERIFLILPPGIVLKMMFLK